MFNKTIPLAVSMIALSTAVFPYESICPALNPTNHPDQFDRSQAPRQGILSMIIQGPIYKQTIKRSETATSL